MYCHPAGRWTAVEVELLAIKELKRLARLHQRIPETKQSSVRIAISALNCLPATYFNLPNLNEKKTPI